MGVLNEKRCKNGTKYPLKMSINLFLLIIKKIEIDLSYQVIYHLYCISIT